MGELPRESVEVVHAFNREFQTLRKMVLTGQDQLGSQKMEEIYKLLSREEANLPLLCPQLLELLGRLFVE